MLRAQIGTERVKALLKTERRRKGKAGGVRLSDDVQIMSVDAGLVNIDPEELHAAKADKTGQAPRQRGKFEAD
jgi:hypothetical protein